MSKTIHRDNYKIVTRPTHIEDEDWERIFKRNDKNTEKNRYKRGNKGKHGEA